MRSIALRLTLVGLTAVVVMAIAQPANAAQEQAWRGRCTSVSSSNWTYCDDASWFLNCTGTYCTSERCGCTLN